MPRPAPISKVMLPYLTSEQKEKLCSMRASFAITAIRYRTDNSGPYPGAKWECTIVPQTAEILEGAEFLLTLTSNAVRDRWFEVMEWQTVSEDNPIEPCVLEKRKLPNQPKGRNDAWEIVDPNG